MASSPNREIDPMVRLTVTEAVRSFSEIVSRVLYRGESFLLLRGGRPVARLLPTEERPVVSGADLSRAWETWPRLSSADAGEFERDLAEGRAVLSPEERGAWE